MLAMYLVVGGTGFLGVEIVKTLLAPSDGLPQRVVFVQRHADPLPPALQSLASHITVLVVPKPHEQGAIENALNEKNLTGQLTGIFHVAGLVKHSTSPKDVSAMYESNVTLSDAVFALAVKHQLRTVYASSSGVVGCQDLSHASDVADDDGPICTTSIAAFPYYRQKAQVESFWRHRADCPVIFMRPSLLLGPGDDRLSSVTVVHSIIGGKLPFLVPGGVSFVDVRDVAAAFVAAMVRVNTVPLRSAFNLTAANMPFTDFVTLVAVVGQIPRNRVPKWTVPPVISRMGARLLTAGNQWMRRPKDPLVDPTFAEVGLRFWNIRSTRAQELLDFHPRAVKTTLWDTIMYYDEHPAFRNSGAVGSSRSWCGCRREVLIGAMVVLALLLLVWQYRRSS